MKIVAVLLGLLTVTSYRSIKNQTDTSPFETSIGEHCYNGGAAISQDRLCGACRRLHKRCTHPENPTKIHYGDCLYVEGIGYRIVNDCMGRFKHWRIKTNKGLKKVFKKQDNWIDIWVSSYKEEHRFHSRFGIKEHKVWKIQEIKESYEAK